MNANNEPGLNPAILRAPEQALSTGTTQTQKLDLILDQIFH